MESLKNSYCSYCGAEFDLPLVFSSTCRQCAQITYLNPLPVSVVLIPVEMKENTGKSLLCIIRNIDPGKGGLALPGGFIELNESWQEAAAREVLEETGIRIKADDLNLQEVISVPGTILIFSMAKAIQKSDLDAFRSNEEISELKILTKPEKMVFSAHTAMVEKFFGLV
ncbi:MAG: NUDIX domain-containing protein [Cytophagaceae bacterium]